MNKKWKLMLPIVAALLLLSLLAPAVALAQTTTAARDIADQTLAPGDTTQVTVTIAVAEAEALALDEDIPTGWTLAQVSADPVASAFNANTNEWVWFQAAVGTITVVYDLTVPSDADGSYAIAGTIVGEDWSEAVGGETDITVAGVPPEGTTATRDIADQTLAPGDTTQVTVTIAVAEAEALALDEAHPAGWTLAQVSEDPAADAFNANTNEWVWFQAAVGTITVVYDLTVPSDADGPYTIDGRIVGEDWSEGVGGEIDITVGPTPVPPPEVELEFSGTLAGDETAYLTTIPAGVTDLEITLSATADIDLNLYDADTFVIGWGGEIDSSGSTTDTYEGDTFAYSGWRSGEEDITAAGPLGRAYDLEVYGYQASDYTVTVSYVLGAPPNPPPTISITVPATVALGNPVTVTVSATDDDGVRVVMFMVSSPYSEEWNSNSNSEYGDIVEYVMSFDDEASLTFTPGWAGTYTVEAWASDELGNMTPTETDTFVVTE